MNLSALALVNAIKKALVHTEAASDRAFASPGLEEAAAEIRAAHESLERAKSILERDVE